MKYNTYLFIFINIFKYLIYFSNPSKGELISKSICRKMHKPPKRRKRTTSSQFTKKKRTTPSQPANYYDMGW